MGNNQPPSPNDALIKKIKYQDFELVKKINDGKSILRHKQTSQLCVVIEHTFPSEELLNQYIKQHKNTLNITHQFYLNAFDHQILSLANICSKQYKIIQYFDYQCHTLKEEIESRSITDKYFSSKQILSILCSCVLAMSHFSKLQVVHYTLTPSDIVINDDGICKILNLSLSEFVFDFNIKKNFYYAPETLKIFKMQSTSNGLTNKSAVFTLGMTILNMIYLTPMNRLYNFNNLTINTEDMNELINKIEDIDLQLILTKMLKYHSYERITFTELEEMLFDIISKSQNQDGNDPYIQNYKTQTNKLQESIVKIKHQNSIHQIHQNHQSRASLFQNYSSNHQTAQICPNDYEDFPQQHQDHELISQYDTMQVDQNDKNNHLQYYSGRDSILQSQIQSNLNRFSNYSTRNNRILTENLNVSNLTQTKKQNLYKKNEFENNCLKNTTQTQKMPRISTQKCLQTVYPQYVNEVMKQGRYQGYKLGKYRHGFGTFYYNEGEKYCGEWVKNRMEGRGVLYYPSSKIAYEGQWLQDMLHGYGVIYNENVQIVDSQLDFTHLQLISNEWIKYEGYFKNDLKDGQGSINFTNGQTFRGMFQNDHPNGLGQFRNIRGEVFKGFWLMGALNSIS